MRGLTTASNGKFILSLGIKEPSIGRVNFTFVKMPMSIMGWASIVEGKKPKSINIYK
jgi:hypothetical protein